MDVADIHLAATNLGGWVIFIEGSPVGFTSIEALVGSGASSWIGTTYGARSIQPGLMVPDLPLGETDPYGAMIREARVSFRIVDHGGVAELFREFVAGDQSDSMAARMSPRDDPAPEFIAGPNQTPIGTWGRHIGTEAIGPAGERRQYWMEPTGSPPGLDHIAGIGWPPSLITDDPVTWAGRIVGLYRIVKDPDTGTYPSWTDQHEGGSLFWVGKLKGRGVFQSDRNGARVLDMPVSGPASLLRKPCNLAKPSRWRRPEGGISLTGDRAKVAVWIRKATDEQVGDGISVVPSTFESMTLESGHDLAGLTTREEIVAQLQDIVATTIDGLDHGTVTAVSLATWTGPDIAPAGVWAVPPDNPRDVAISSDGSEIKIKCESPTVPLNDRGYAVGIAADATVFQLLGWDVGQLEIGTAGQHGNVCPVGGKWWGESDGDEALPPLHYIGYFTTWEQPIDPIHPDLWAFGGLWQVHTAAYQTGTITLQPDGGDEVRLGVGEVITEGQFGQPYTFGSQIDGTDVDATGWWIFRGQRLTAANFLAGEDPEDYMQIALCEWVKTSGGDAIADDTLGYARMKVIRWEDPRRFGIDFETMTEPWVMPVGGLECAPIAVIGGINKTGPDWRHRLIPRVLLSSGTVGWGEAAGVVSPTPGDNHPADMPANDPWAGDIEIADLGLGLPAGWVDWQSWYACAALLPGGGAPALNRVTYSMLGPRTLEQVLAMAMGGAGWAWSWKRVDGVPAFGCWDPAETLSPAQSEVTLSRAFASERVSAGSSNRPQWRAAVSLRNEGPFDRFVFDVGGNPLSNGLDYQLTYESLDPYRRYRDGKIQWPVEDAGLRNPTPWLSTAVEGLYSWTEAARVRFADRIGNRFAQARRVYVQDFDATFITRVGLGTVALVVDPSAEAPDGTRGVNHMGRVINATILAEGGIRVWVLLQPESVDDVKVNAPSATARAWDSGTNTVTISTDWASVGGGHDDSIGFEQPPWDSHAAGALRVILYQSETGKTFPAGFEVRADVVTASSGAITLTNIVGTLYRDTIKWVLMAPYDEQTAEWALSIYSPVTEATGLYDGVTKGWPL